MHLADCAEEKVKNPLFPYDHLKDKKYPFVDTKFKLSENYDASNKFKFTKPLLEQKSNKIELSQSKTVESIGTKNFVTFSTINSENQLIPLLIVY